MNQDVIFRFANIILTTLSDPIAFKKRMAFTKVKEHEFGKLIICKLQKKIILMDSFLPDLKKQYLSLSL